MHSSCNQLLQRQGQGSKGNDLLHKASDCNISWEMVTLPFASE